MKKKIALIGMILMLTGTLFSCKKKVDFTKISLEEAVNFVTLEANLWQNVGLEENVYNLNVNNGKSLNQVYPDKGNPEIGDAAWQFSIYHDYGGRIMPSGFEKEIDFKDIYECFPMWNPRIGGETYMFYYDQVYLNRLKLSVYMNSYYDSEITSISFEMKLPSDASSVLIEKKDSFENSASVKGPDYLSVETLEKTEDGFVRVSVSDGDPILYISVSDGEYLMNIDNIRNIHVEYNVLGYSGYITIGSYFYSWYVDKNNIITPYKEENYITEESL